MKPESNSRKTLEIVYTWQDGREEVRYRRPAGTDDARRFMEEVDTLRRANPGSPYSYRFV